MTVPHDNPDNESPDISVTPDGHDRIGQSPEFLREHSDEPDNGAGYGNHVGTVNIEQHS